MSGVSEENPGAASYRRSVTEAHRGIVAALDEVLTLLDGGEAKAKTAAAQALKKSVERLLLIIAYQPDRPRWLLDLNGAVTRYLQSGAESGRLTRFLIEQDHRIRHHKWDQLGEPVDPGIELDELYDRYATGPEIDQLFDQLIEQLVTLADSGLIESIKVRDALRTLIATLKKNARGHSRSKWRSVGMAVIFVKHLGVEYGRAIPGVGPLIAAIEKTIAEMHEKADLAEVAAGEDLKAILGAKSLELPIRELLRLPGPPPQAELPDVAGPSIEAPTQ